MTIFKVFLFVLAFGLVIGSEMGLADGLTLQSPTLTEGAFLSPENVFDGYGCQGANFSPDLRWFGAPAGTRFYALTLFDPDAAGGAGWWHWGVVNIPADITHFPLGAGSKGGPLPGGEVLKNDFALTEYGGPCPPVGDPPHHYVFTLYALRDAVSFSPSPDWGRLRLLLDQQSLAHAQLTGKYGR